MEAYLKRLERWRAERKELKKENIKSAGHPVQCTQNKGLSKRADPATQPTGFPIKRLTPRRYTQSIHASMKRAKVSQSEIQVTETRQKKTCSDKQASKDTAVNTRRWTGELFNPKVIAGHSLLRAQDKAKPGLDCSKAQTRNNTHLLKSSKAVTSKTLMKSEHCEPGTAAQEIDPSRQFPTKWNPQQQRTVSAKPFSQQNQSNHFRHLTRELSAFGRNLTHKSVHPVTGRRLTQEVKKPHVKLTDPGRLTPPVVQKEFTLDWSYPANSKGKIGQTSDESCGKKNRKEPSGSLTTSEAQAQVEEDQQRKESPDMRFKLEEWQQRKQVKKAQIARRKTLPAFKPSGVPHLPCIGISQPSSDCTKQKHNTHAVKRSKCDNKNINNIKVGLCMLTSTADHIGSTRIPSQNIDVKRTKSLGGKPMDTSKKCRSAKSNLRCSWSMSNGNRSLDNILHFRRSPRTAGDVCHSSISSRATKHRSAPGNQIVTKPLHRADPSKVKIKLRRSILKGNLHEAAVVEAVHTSVDQCTNHHMQKVTFCSPEHPHQNGSYAMKTPIKRRARSTGEESMRVQLDAWLSARGQTPSRFHHLRCFGVELSAKKKTQPPATTGLTVDELAHQQECLAAESSESPTETMEDDKMDIVQHQLNNLLDECIMLFEAGCASERIGSWLDEIAANIPAALQTAKYWVCRAHVAEQEWDDELAVDQFEQAVQHQAAPADEVAAALKEFVVRMEDRKQAIQLAANTPGPGRIPLDVLSSNVFESSSVRYIVNSGTPFMKRLNPAGSQSTPGVVVTPVRRSTRRSCSNLPSMLRDHDVIIESLDEVSDTTALFQPNRALEKDFEEAKPTNTCL